MAFSTFPNNPFPPSTAQFNEGKNDAIQAEIDAIKDGTTIDSFGGVETALATKTNLSNIAPAFDATSGVYAIGDKVIYDGVLYEFTSAHATAGEWDESEVQPVKVSELVDALKSGLTNLFDSTTILAWGNYGGETPVEYTTTNNYSVNRLIRIKAGTNGRYVYYFTPTDFSADQVFEAVPDGTNYITLQFTAQNKIIIYAKDIKVREVVMFNNVSL